MTVSAERDAARAHEGSFPHADGFEAHFREHIAPHFAGLEKKRLVLKNQYQWRLAVAVAGTLCAALIAAIVYLLIGGDGRTNDWQAMIFLPVAAGLGLAAWTRGPRRRFARRYKETLLPAVAGYFGNFLYESRGGIRMSRLKESTIIPSHDRYHHEDLFNGTYRDVGVEFCEARLTERRGNGRKRHTVTVFAGVFVLLTMNKDFSGKTVVRRDKGTLGNWFEGTFSEFEPVKLEDPEFERQFAVYSDDQVEARYLLTPAFMTRLTDLGRALGTDKIEAAFFGNRLMIKLPLRGAAGGGSSSLSLS
ncbi:MAG: DUF3137 domain-containing protein, partial [Alphaproteobacteria bacterium]